MIPETLDSATTEDLLALLIRQKANIRNTLDSARTGSMNMKINLEKYREKTIVIKYGGNAMINEELKAAVMEDMVFLSEAGIRVVLVHGGGPEINQMLQRVGKEPKFINGLRYTDKETMDIVTMILAGKVNKSLVALIHKNRGKAIGLCGVDGGMLQVKKHQGELDLGMVGDIITVDGSSLEMALDQNLIPVIATLGVDEKGEIYNINADTAAAAIAGALKAEKLISMTDIKGVLLDKDNEETLLSRIKTRDVAKLIGDGVISGGMIPKIQSCVEGLEQGVKEAMIIDGRVRHAVLGALESEEAAGTVFYTE